MHIETQPPQATSLTPDEVQLMKDYPIRIIVAGTRGFDDMEYFSDAILDEISDFKDKKILFISGAAKTGADRLIIDWCKEHNYPCREYPAYWDTNGKSAGYMRNNQMLKMATHLVAFWDKKSNGTKNMIDISSAKKIPITIRTVNPTKYTYFFGAANPLSQWYISPFVYKKIEFNCCEQFMMYAKAKLFNDHEIAEKILAEKDPAKQKELGRKVRGFDEEIWKAKREQIVFIGNLNKFNQNPEAKQFLLKSGKSILVEASGYDTIWGVGLWEDDPLIKDPKNWKGLNLLGKALMRAREKFQHGV